MTMTQPQYLVVDLFCGAGGTTIGFEQSNSAKVIAAVNHDPKAIESHWKNHPNVKHFEEDIRTLDLTELVEYTRQQRLIYPGAKLILWASLECTNFSKAKGGLPRDADSRTLADHLHRYVDALRPDEILIENVVEFMSWGPLDEKGKPISRKNGCDWLRWRREMCAHQYKDEWRELNSADFGARTSRNRLFGQFVRPSESYVWPEPTHTKNPGKQGMFEGLSKWNACRPCLDLDDHGTSIFTQGKIRSDKTFERIFAGLVKFVAGMNQKEFLSKYYSGKPEGKNISCDGPAGTFTTSDSHALVQTEFLLNYHHSSNADSIDRPHGAVTASDKMGLVQTEFLLKYNSASATGEMQHSVTDVNSPCPTIPAQRQPNVVQIISGYYGSGDNNTSIDEVAPTVVTGDRHALVSSEWLDLQYSNGKRNQSVEDPAGGITTVPKMNLVQTQFIMDTQFNNVGHSIDEPAATITSNRKWHYLMNPQYMNAGGDPDKPCFTLIARMDKMPPYLVQVDGGRIAIEVYSTDTEIMRRIKMFMAMYGIADIKMRMLKVIELKRIQGFPEDYILLGTQADQKKFIGNSVHPQVIVAWMVAKSERRNGQCKVA